MAYLNFNSSNCRNCYKCLRECPVKAISVLDDKAQINEELCILCGHCVGSCRFNAKVVASDIAKVRDLISRKKVYVSLAPSFISSFDVKGFAAMEKALKALGFESVEETAIGAAAVTDEYKKLLEGGKYRNLIASACPATVRRISQFYPDALPFLAPADSPMVAHARQLKKAYKNCAVVFVGPCLAKKREAAESGIIDAVLTFEELEAMLAEAKITPDPSLEDDKDALRARYYPINRGIIKSFDGFVDGYEYLSVDGVNRSRNVLENITTLEGMFIEMHACEFSCINGPCALTPKRGGLFKATEQVREYTRGGLSEKARPIRSGDYSHKYERIPMRLITPPDYEIRAILEATGKYKPEDELNCGACGYPTCRDKAIAVYNGMAEIDMCVPYMREKAESLSFDIIQNSPNGILAVDESFRITDINEEAARLLSIPRNCCKGELLERYFNPTDFYIVASDGKAVDDKKIKLEKSGAWVEMSIRKVSGQNLLFCIMKDITEETEDKSRLDKLKEDTYRTTDEVIGKQMRVVQEIASLLGETAAETKIALLKLKNTLKTEEE